MVKERITFMEKENIFFIIDQEFSQNRIDEDLKIELVELHIIFINFGFWN